MNEMNLFLFVFLLRIVRIRRKIDYTPVVAPVCNTIHQCHRAANHAISPRHTYSSYSAFFCYHTMIYVMHNIFRESFFIVHQGVFCEPFNSGFFSASIRSNMVIVKVIITMHFGIYVYDEKWILQKSYKRENTMHTNFNLHSVFFYFSSRLFYYDF